LIRDIARRIIESIDIASSSPWIPLRLPVIARFLYASHSEAKFVLR
jgi:hypothetical protein